MLQPQIRPDGSTQVLRYRGPISVADGLAKDFPKLNGEMPVNTASSPNVGFTAWARFALFDTTDIENERRRFAAGAFDDSQLAGVSPHGSQATVASTDPGINAGEIWIGDRTWAQNIRIHEGRIDGLVVAADIGIATSPDASAPSGALVLLDTLTSGLGLNTGLPVIAVRFFVANMQAVAPFDVDLTFEIRHTLIR